MTGSGRRAVIPHCLAFVLILCAAGSAGCATTPSSSPALRQQADASLVVSFQSWSQIGIIKPDVTGAAGANTFHPKTFSKEAFVKLLDTLHVPRDFAVIVLDERYNAGQQSLEADMDEIESFFTHGLGFQRVAFQDDAGWNAAAGMPVLRDTGATTAPQ